jgi:hypothetical protein
MVVNSKVKTTSLFGYDVVASIEDSIIVAGVPIVTR